MKNWFAKMFKKGSEPRIHPLHVVALFGLFILAGLSLLESSLTPSMRREMDRMLSAVLPGTIVDLTNEERIAQNLGTLKRNPLLDEAARLKAEHMKEHDYFAHFSPEGVSPWHWFDVAKYDYVYAGENLAVYFDDSKEVVDAWMDSPLHKENILKREYTEIGVAVVEGEHEGYSTYFVVQLFGTPAKQTTPAQKTPTVQTIAKADVPQAQKPETPTTVLGETEVTQKERQLDTPEEILSVGEEDTTEIRESEESNDAPVEEIRSDRSDSTLVEKVQVEDKTVYVATHASTSTIPTIGSTEDTSTGGEGTPRGVLYTILLFAVACITVASIVVAKKNNRPLHALYGVVLLILTLALGYFHTHVVMAMQSVL